MAVFRVVLAFLMLLISVCVVFCEVNVCDPEVDKPVVPECSLEDRCGAAADACISCVLKNRIVGECTSLWSLRYIPVFPTQIDTLCIRSPVYTIEKADFFANVSSISALEIIGTGTAEGGAVAVSTTALKLLKNLTRFRLVGDKTMSDSEIGNILEAVPTLRELGLTDCNLNSVAGNRSPLPKYLDNLDMTINLLETLHLGPQSGLAVRRADFRQNYLHSVYVSSILPHLEELLLGFNSLRSFPNTCTKGGESYFPNLRLLDLSSNKLRATPETDEHCLPKLEVLVLDNNDFMDAFLFSSNFPSLVMASFQNCPDCDFGFDHMPALECVYLNNVDTIWIDKLIEYFHNCSRLRFLDISQNLIVDEEEEFKSHSQLEPMQSFQNVEYLLLASCDLGGKSDRTALSTLIDILPNLVLLDISDNNLHVIQSGLFDGLLKLRHLYLISNFLTVVSPDMFSAVTRERLESLDFSNNPFACSCDILWFKSWIESSPSKFVDTQDYWCVKGDRDPDIRLLDYKLSEQACLLSHEAYVAITYIILFTLLFAMITVSVWRFKWHLRLLLYDMFRGPGDARRLRLQHGHFDYDVFVSYDSDDQLWVFGKLVPELEGRLGLKLCLHERDFVPGTQIIDNIAKRVEASKKILMVWSRNFVDSKWCQFELTFCLQHAMDTEDALVIVCLDDVTSSKDITPAMMAVLKTTTYIQWVGERRGQTALDSFWGRLRVALQEVIPEAEHQV